MESIVTLVVPIYNMERYLPDYLRSSRYGIGRKIQAILAAVSPRVFTRVKNLLHKRLT